jgi:hypothetical protein
MCYKFFLSEKGALSGYVILSSIKTLTSKFIWINPIAIYGIVWRIRPLGHMRRAAYFTIM